MANRQESLKYPRTHAFHSQHGRCYYCNQPMWLKSPLELIPRYGISHGQAKLLQCTGEHLIEHSKGGGSGRNNIVAACFYCNKRRHARKQAISPERYKAHVRTRLSKGDWHGLALTK